MKPLGWKQLVAGWPWFEGEGRFPLRGGCEFTPPVRVFRKPYGTWDPIELDNADPFGWPVTEYEEALSIRPGLRAVARWALGRLDRFGRGLDRDDLAGFEPRQNPYWPGDCRRPPEHERFVLLLPLALSQSTDDKGRVTWTVYGGSEQGPARPFWLSFYSAPGIERPAAEADAFLRRLLQGISDAPVPDDPHAAGLRILSQGSGTKGFPAGEPLPSWVDRYRWSESDSLRGVKYLLTFRPYRRLPPKVRKAYRAGALHLLPFPGSLAIWGIPSYAKLRKRLPYAMQIPLLHILEREAGITGMRIPQSGWFVEPEEDEAEGQRTRGGPLREKIRRSHKQEYVPRDEDNLVQAREHWLVDALFSTEPKHIGLYEKPLARNAQIWDRDFRLVLNGETATPEQIRRVGRKVEAGGEYGYRVVAPPMRVGRHEVFWHRPLVAYRTSKGHPAVIDDAPTGYLTAYDPAKPNLDGPIELWPRFIHRELHAANIEQFGHPDEQKQTTLLNVRKLLECFDLIGKSPLPRTLARQLLTCDPRTKLDGWLKSLPTKARDRERGQKLAAGLAALITREETRIPAAITYDRTADRAFEVAYWDAIADLSTGAYPNANNADCVLDQATRKYLQHTSRDLDPLGEYLLARHAQSVAEAGMTGKALVGELPFHWHTDFAYPWMNGWKGNQDGSMHERNLLVVIPGKNRREAVVFADHYDTAYMEDYYDPAEGGSLARVAAPGADDNFSATATLLLAAPIFLDLAKRGELGCDVWLLHLTGEEYPAAGLGAAEFCRQLVEGTMQLHDRKGRRHDLSATRCRGLYVMDMIAHNVKPGKYIFQIAPGSGREAMWLAHQAHLAAARWNANVDGWNRKRRGAGRYRRRKSGREVPAIAPHPFMYDEIRAEYEPRSTLFNTDAQVFSDNGVPVVLFMEDYDIDREGYHDIHDNLANIDLDYGSALAAIAIESVARAASVDRPVFEQLG